MLVVTTVEGVLESIRASAQRGGSRHRLVTIVGAPGSRKSTLTTALTSRLEHAMVIPMDGFHLDDSLLVPMGKRASKGAPDTFDVDGFGVLLERLAADDSAVHIPVFDRDIELSRAAAATVTSNERILLVEGNYLLLDVPRWRDLKTAFDLSVMIEIPEHVLRERLVRRWLDHGLSASQAEQKAFANDLPNGELVGRASSVPDVVYRPDPAA